MVGKRIFQTNSEVALKDVFDEHCEQVMLRISCFDLIKESAYYHVKSYRKLVNKTIWWTATGYLGKLLKLQKKKVQYIRSEIRLYLGNCIDKCFTLQELIKLGKLQHEINTFWYHYSKIALHLKNFFLHWIILIMRAFQKYIYFSGKSTETNENIERRVTKCF